MAISRFPFRSSDFAGNLDVHFVNVACPSCSAYRACKEVEQDPARADPAVISPVRRCTMQSVRDGLGELELSGLRVLEVGCGDWAFAKDIVEAAGGRWTGVDVYATSLTTTVINGRDLPFGDGEFDVVIANQVLEHVHDCGCPPEDMVAEMARVLKPGGHLLCNVPVHLHGGRRFRHGNLDEMLRMFSAQLYSDLRVVYYRRDPGDLAPARVLVDYASGGWIIDRYRYQSDEDTWRRSSTKRKGVRAAATSLIGTLDLVHRLRARLHVDVMTDNPYARSAYVADFRARRHAGAGR